MKNPNHGKLPPKKPIVIRASDESKCLRFSPPSPMTGNLLYVKIRRLGAILLPGGRTTTTRKVDHRKRGSWEGERVARLTDGMGRQCRLLLTNFADPIQSLSLNTPLLICCLSLMIIIWLETFEVVPKEVLLSSTKVVCRRNRNWNVSIRSDKRFILSRS